MKLLLIRPLLLYFRLFASLALRIHQPEVVGITGSVGKSSAREAIAAVLSAYYPTKVIEKGNSEIGIPLGILGLQVNSLGFQTPLRSVADYIRLLVLAVPGLFFLRGTKYLVIEMGVDEPEEPKNMTYLLRIVKPHIAV